MSQTEKYRKHCKCVLGTKKHFENHLSCVHGYVY